MSEPKFTLLVASPECADNGALSHYNLCDPDTGEKIGIFCDEDAMIRNTEKREEQYAKLFAAAPEMYEMLERIQDYMTGGPILAKKPSVEEIAHLLEKARGER